MSSPHQDVKLLSVWSSPSCARVIVALHAKGIPFECIEEDLKNKSQLLLESNPVHQKVPVLIHNGKAIAESLIISEYIDEAWPSEDGKGFLPSSSYDRAVTRFWADYIDKKLYEAGKRVLSTFGKEHEDAVEAFIQTLAPLDDALKVMSKGKPYFNGDHMGYLDIALVSYTPVISAMEMFLDVEIFDEGKLPHLTKWVQIVQEEACVREAFPDPMKFVDVIKSKREGLLSV